MRRGSGEVRWLWTRARLFRSLYLAQLSVVLLSSLLGVADPLILKWLLDDVLPWRNSGMLGLAAAAMLAVQAANLLFLSTGFLIDTYASERLMLALRLELLRHLQGLSPEYFLRNPAGDLLHRLEQDVRQIRELGGQAVASLLRIGVMTTLAAGILVALNLRLALLIFSLVPMAIGLRAMGMPRLRRAADRAQAAEARRSAFLQDHLTGIPQVQLLNRMAGERRRFVAIARAGLEAAVQRRLGELTMAYGTHLVAVLANGLVLGVGGAQVLRGTLTLGGLVAFHSYLSQVFGPTQSLANLSSSFQRVGASVRRLREVLETRPTVTDPPRPVRLSGRGPLAVTLHGIRFSYPGERPVLCDLDLTLRAGERVALIGSSGGGKSTIARLLTRMYDPEAGSITLDGVDLRELELRHLRAQVALVPQEPILFDASFRQNLLCAAPGAGPACLERAIETAQLRKTLEQLPQGWDEPVGPRGGRLSGGERQRLAVARAVLQEPRLLILDEATSALDAMTEHRLLRNLEAFVSDRVTTLLIAHRLSAIRWADRVVMLQGGQVAAEGCHEDLYRSSEIYREICDRQLRPDTLPTEPNAGAAARGVGR